MSRRFPARSSVDRMPLRPSAFESGSGSHVTEPALRTGWCLHGPPDLGTPVPHDGVHAGRRVDPSAGGAVDIEEHPPVPQKNEREEEEARPDSFSAQSDRRSPSRSTRRTAPHSTASVPASNSVQPARASSMKAARGSGSSDSSGSSGSSWAWEGWEHARSARAVSVWNVRVIFCLPRSRSEIGLKYPGRATVPTARTPGIRTPNEHAGGGGTARARPGRMVSRELLTADVEKPPTDGV